MATPITGSNRETSGNGIRPALESSHLNVCFGSQADMCNATRDVRFAPKADSVLSAWAPHRRGEHSLIGFHDATFPFACAHLVGCEAVLIVRNGTFVVVARPGPTCLSRMRRYCDTR